MEPVTEVYLAAVQSAGQEPSMMELILHADFIVQGVLLMLVAMSVMCWSIIIQKSMQIRAASRSAAFLENSGVQRLDTIYEQTGLYVESGRAVFKAGYKSWLS